MFGQVHVKGDEGFDDMQYEVVSDEDNQNIDDFDFEEVEVKKGTEAFQNNQDYEI